MKDIKSKTFSKNDLEVGMKVQLANGKIGICLAWWENNTTKELYIRVSDGEVYALRHYNTNLNTTPFYKSECNIVAVYKPISLYSPIDEIYCTDTCVWRKTKKMSLSDIEEALGYPIELIED